MRLWPISAHKIYLFVSDEKFIFFIKDIKVPYMPAGEGIPVDIWEIETFVAVARTRNLSHAARQLHVTQAAITYRLKNLERKLGASVLDRRRGMRRITLTPLGEDFVPIAERWLELWEETQQLASQGHRRTLVVGAVDSMNAYVLPPVYRALSQIPFFHLQVRTQQSDELYELVERQEIDVGLALQERYSASLLVRPVFSEPMVVLRAIEAEPFVSPVHPADLSPANELYIDWSPTFRTWHERWWGPASTSRIRVDTAQLLLALFTASDQWAIVPQSMGEALVHGGRFALQRLADPPPDRVCYQLTHKRPRASRALSIRLFEECFQKCLGQAALATLSEKPSPRAHRNP
jgi:DNA-binding transcriptional LysR family regulator